MRDRVAEARIPGRRERSEPWQMTSTPSARIVASMPNDDISTSVRSSTARSAAPPGCPALAM
jgi:hypothetical protein